MEAIWQLVLAASGSVVLILTLWKVSTMPQTHKGIAQRFNVLDNRYVVSARLGRVIKVIQILGAAVFLVYVGLYEFYGFSLGIVPNTTTGAIYPLNLHGHVVYLNHSQDHLMGVFGALAFFFGAIFASIAGCLLYRQRKN